MGINGISQKETRLILFVCLRLAQCFQRLSFFISASLMSLKPPFELLLNIYQPASLIHGCINCSAKDQHAAVNILFLGAQKTLQEDASCGNDKAAIAAPAAKACFEEANKFMEAVPLKVRSTAQLCTLCPAQKDIRLAEG